MNRICGQDKLEKNENPNPNNLCYKRHINKGNSKKT